MKINTNELRQDIQALLDGVYQGAKSVYLENKTPTTYPYMVFELKPLSSTDGKTQQRLEVNIFTKSQAQCEDIADKVEEQFDHYEYSDTKVAFYTYKGQRQNVLEEDKETKRIRLTIELYSYSREE